MKTRIIHTKFWDDDFVLGLDKDSRLLFQYLLTCPFINISGIFEVPVPVIKLHTGLTDLEIQTAKDILQANGKIYFFHSWVKVVNVDRFNSYKNSPKNQTAYEKELEVVPNEVIVAFMGMDTSMDTSIDTPINHKSKIKKGESEGESEGEYGLTWLREFIARRDDAEALKIGGKYTKNPYKVFEMTEKVVLYVEAKGRKYKNYKAVIQQWLNNDLQHKKEKAGGDWLRPEDF